MVTTVPVTPPAPLASPVPTYKPCDQNFLPQVVWVGDWPLLWEDDEEGDMGEANLHVLTDEILHVCLSAHFADQPDVRVYSNMNLYYQARLPAATRPPPYVSPDTMIVRPSKNLPEAATSYRLEVDGPEPLVVIEIQSERSAQQRDLAEKKELYAKLRIPEYILVDPVGDHVPERLRLYRRSVEGSWDHVREVDGGVTSLLGFRLIIDDDHRLRVVNAATGHRYIRPMEAEAEARARAAAEAAHEAEARARAAAEAAHEAEARAREAAEAQVQALAAEVARLKARLNSPES